MTGTGPSPQARHLVIGYGNPGRQDDGLGPAAARAIEALGWPHVTTLDNYQLTLEDTLEIVNHDVVWFVDATIDGDEPCRIEPLEPAFDITFTSHLLKPEALIAIAEQQFGKRPAAFLVGIRGYAFEFAEGLTERAEENLTAAVALLSCRIGQPMRIAS
ncbi:hydrogenase maturation protease [Hartmannibacter diazotrophicus]|uniref:Hydrogenase maturation protease n=1 Tax=Hartmannibacter diazotrophicus TaxID=1482074 RepID=A0A2C9D1C9_9HYPH|nr:hydrogenase maturation protease [Hartmannibacter diazotrophicus]SON53968.1 hydrogenase maturation protease [Hartmannibacter diazotrophicus]